MKKQFTAIISAAMILTNFTACSADKEPINNLSNNSSDISDNSGNKIENSGSPESESSNENSSTESSTQSSNESSSAEPVQSNSESIALTPVEFTDEDRELQKILSVLLKPAGEIFSWYAGIVLPTPMLDFVFPQFENETTGSFALIPENYRESNFYSSFEIPTTLDGLREIMLEYFSAEFTERYVKDIAAGTMTENSDGTYFVFFTDGIDQFADGFYSTFLEIDGRLYRRDGLKTASIDMDCETAKIISKTDDTIEFSYLLNSYSYQPKPEYKNEPLYSENAYKGTIKYERGGWKLNSFEIR